MVVIRWAAFVWLHKTGRAARQAGCRSKRQCTDAGAPSSNREAVGGEGVGWEEGGYYAADWAEAVVAGGLEGWKASRKEPRERRRCEWRLVEDTEGREANEDPAERSLGFWGDGSVH